MGKRKTTSEKRKDKAGHKEEVSRRNLVFASAQHDPVFCHLLSQATTADAQYAVVFHLIKHHWLDADLEPMPTVQLFGALLAWANETTIWPTLTHMFQIAITQRKEAQFEYRRTKRALLNEASLNVGAFDREGFLRALPTHAVPRLPVPYPPQHKYAAESSDIAGRNRKFVHDRGLPDCRIPRKYMFDVDPSKLSYDVDGDESAVLEDDDGPFLVVIRDACKRADVVAFMDEVIQEVVDCRTNIRKEDPGHLSQMGLSAGSRNGGILDWVRNVRRQKTNLAQQCRTNYRASSAFAVLWSLSRTMLPDVVVDDVKDFMSSIGNQMRMDGNKTMKCDSEGRGKYAITIQGVDYAFSGAMAELAPPAGVMGENYCRYIHKEKQPHRWAISMTTYRAFDSAFTSEQAGGHFYVASHGVRVRAQENTIIAWRPEDWHGTSLLLIDPSTKAKEYHQRGLSFVTSSRLPGAIAARNAGLMSDAELEAIAIAPEEDAQTEESKELDNFVEGLRRSARIAALTLRKRTERKLQ